MNPTLIGRRTLLRAPERSDLLWCFDLLVRDPAQFRYHFRGRTVSPRAVAELVFGGDAQVGLFESRRSSEPIGLGITYDRQPAAGNCHIATVVDPRARRASLALEGAVLHFHQIFDVEGFQRVFVEVAEYNLPQFSSGMGSAFETVGRLSEHTFYAGRYWDSVIAMMTASVWQSIRSSSRVVQRSLDGGELL